MVKRHFNMIWSAGYYSGMRKTGPIEVNFLNVLFLYWGIAD